MQPRLLRKPVSRALSICGLAFSSLLCHAQDTGEIVERATAAPKADWAADPSWACIERDEALKGGKLTSKTFEVLMVDGSDCHLPLAVDD